ncbi:MAG: hypothetical protein IKP37_11105 [Paludibacteraceae bacterium]|nr:hypothetical protein [Paludibacteraceae bacterium]
MPKKKISFNWLHLSSMDENEEEFKNVKSSLLALLSYISKLPKVQRKYDLTKDKFCFIEYFSFEENSQCVELLFKSAKHSYRAPLLNKNTVKERENPKLIEEGEQIKTHVLLKFIENDAIAFLETGLNLMTMSNIVEYLNSFTATYNIVGKFSFDMMPRDDFREVLDSMKRVVCAELFINKSLLGSDALNFCNITEDIQENMVLSLKSEKKKSIKESIYQVISNLSGADSKINRIRVRGKMPNNNDGIIDTSFIIKKEYIEVERDEDTGEFNTPSMFAQLKILANDF